MQRDSQLPPEILEDLKPLRVLARNWPGKLGGLDPSTVFRFKNKGSGGVRLRALKVPGVGWCSCSIWVAEFFSATGMPVSVPQVERRRKQGDLLRDRLSDATKPGQRSGR